jgi:hypothetical protein
MHAWPGCGTQLCHVEENAMPLQHGYRGIASSAVWQVGCGPASAPPSVPGDASAAESPGEESPPESNGLESPADASSDASSLASGSPVASSLASSAELPPELLPELPPELPDPPPLLASSDPLPGGSPQTGPLGETQTVAVSGEWKHVREQTIVARTELGGAFAPQAGALNSQSHARLTAPPFFVQHSLRHALQKLVTRSPPIRFV